MDEENEKLDDDMLEEEESFAELFEGSQVKPVRFNPGQNVKAKIVKISAEWIFLDLGGKSEGYLDKKELLDEEGNLPVKEGDTIEAYFLSSDANELRFTTQITGGDAGRYYLEEAWRNGIPVEGLVGKEIKGGFEIKIAGGLRGFCPFSQMGLQRAPNPQDLIGQHLPFRITQYDEKGRNIILSNRSVLEEERRKQIEAQKETLKEGMKVWATIASIHNFGAFAKIGSLQGLIPISEMGWDRVEDAHDVVEVGQEVEVVVMKLDWENERFSFSMKQALPNPWESIENKFPVGSLHSGTVVRLTNFGAFVSLGPGVDGLLHISKLGAGKRIKHPHEAVSKGQTLEVKIDSIDKENRRISLSLAGSGQVEDSEEANADYSKYTKQSTGSMGTLADLLKAKLGGDKKK